MALKIIDGFDNYNVQADMQTVYSYVLAALTLPVGRFNVQKSLQLSGTAILLTRTLPAAVQSGTLGACYNFVGASLYTGTFSIYFQDNVANQTQLLVNFFPLSGIIQIQRSSAGAPSAGTTIYTSLPNRFSSGTWNYIEIQPKISTTVGSVVININGVQVVNATSLNTQYSANASFGGFGFYGISGINAVKIDDLYFTDTTGAAPWNGFLGELRVQTLFPTVNGSFNQFTPSANTNWQQVREVAMDGDTSYNSANTAGVRDSFLATGLLANTTTIYGVQLTSSARKDDAGQRILANRVLVGTVGGTGDVLGANVALTSGYMYLSDMFQLNPLTTAQWTVSDVNALEYGYQIVS